VIITTDPNELLAPIHDRMPVVLPESAWDTWLDFDNHDTVTLQALLVPSPADELEKWAVSTLVNKADNNGPELLRPVEGAST
jgi:putative SOS response-associated peptidase YedK